MPIIIFLSVEGEDFKQSSLEDVEFAKEMSKQQTLELEKFHSIAKNLDFMIKKLPESGKGCKSCRSYVQGIPRKEHRDGILVFISFSMPKTSLIELNNQADKYNAILVMRGIYKNSFTKMKEKILTISSKGLTVEIDPQLFKQYGIKQVPTYVLLKEGKELNRLTGNVSLEFAYKKLQERE